MTNTPDKSEMKAIERVERRLNSAWAKHGFMTLTVSDLRELLTLARASSRPADQVPEMVEGVAAELAALPVRTEIVNVDTMEKGAQSVEVPLDLRDLILAALKASGEE